MNIKPCYINRNALLGLAAAMIFVSCQNEVRWYPSADVETAHYYK